MVFYSGFQRFKDSKTQRFKDSTAGPASPDARCSSSFIIINAVVWLKRTLVFFVCEYILCNFLNTVVFLNGERFYPIVINIISQLTQIDNLTSAAVVAVTGEGWQPGVGGGCPAAACNASTYQLFEDCGRASSRSFGL